RRAHHAPGARRADAVQAFAGPRLASLHRADAEGHPGGDFRHRRRGRGQCRALRRRPSGRLRSGHGEKTGRVPAQADRRRPERRAAQAVNDEVRRAADILRRGGLVAFPTETVYGLGADACNASAVARLYSVKRRPADHPVIVHFASPELAFAWGREIPDAAKALARKFWPGPLTLILKRSDKAKDFVTGRQDAVGVRVPAHRVANKMLELFGGGVAAPSANRFGEVSPTTAAHVRADLGADVDLVLEGGPTDVGIESTIVDVSGPAPMLLRPGHVSKQDLESVIGKLR